MSWRTTCPGQLPCRGHYLPFCSRFYAASTRLRTVFLTDSSREREAEDKERNHTAPEPAVTAHHHGGRAVDHRRRRIHNRTRRVIHRRGRCRIDRISRCERHPDADTHRNMRLRGAHKAYAECGGSQNLDDLFHFCSPRRGPVHTTGYRNDITSM